jgi:hypothetical protein
MGRAPRTRAEALKLTYGVADRDPAVVAEAWGV